MYALGVDLGTTFTAASTWRAGHAEIASLGSRAAAVPSVVLLREDETFLTGESANRRGLTEPHRVAREFKRRFGDTTPILLGGVPYSAEALMARLLRWTVDEVAKREGGLPDAITVSHPANWGPYKTDLLRQAVRLSGLEVPISFTTEPEAAAVFYASQQRIDPGAIVAVYDLGGGTFDAAVLRKTATGFEILGQPEGIERLGGIDFDAAVFNHVTQALGGKLGELDEDDSAAIAAVARLREECIEAKEALSADTDVSIPVLLPNVTTEVRLTRGELEAMVRPALHGSIEALKRALRSAGVEPEQLHSVLLVGGSSRMPIVAQLVGAELNRPVAVDAHPKHAVALGAAWLAAGPKATQAAGPAPGTAAARGSATVTIHQPPQRKPASRVYGAGAGAAASGSAPGGVAPTSGPPVAATPTSGPPLGLAPTGGRPVGPVPTSAPPVSPAAGSAPISSPPVSPAGGRPVSPVGGQRVPPVAGPPVSPAGGPPPVRQQQPPPGYTQAGYAPPHQGQRPPGYGGPAQPPPGYQNQAAPTQIAPPGFLDNAARQSPPVYATGRAGSGPAPTYHDPGPPQWGNGGYGPPAPPVTPPKKRGRAALIAAAVVIVLAIGGGVAWANRDTLLASGGGDPTTPPTGAATQTQKAAPPADEQCTDAIKANDRWVCITLAFVDSEKFVVEFDADWGGQVPDNDDGFHLHIYGGDGKNPPAEKMGYQSDEPGRFYLEDASPSVRAVGGGNYKDIIGDNKKVCARISDADDRLVKDKKGGYETGNCFTIRRPS